MAFAIVINEKGGQPRRQEFMKGEITIGRVQGNDIVLPKQNVSKRHSRVVLKNGKFVITDLKSTNGTYVNGRKITTPMVIKETDKIYIGDFVLSAELIDGAAEGVSTPGIAPPPPPANSVSGSRPPFPGNMPAKTIASGISPFAQEARDQAQLGSTGGLPPSLSPMTEAAPPPQPTPPPPSLPINEPEPPAPLSSPFGGTAATPAPTPPPALSTPTPVPVQASSSPFGTPSMSPPSLFGGQPPSAPVAPPADPSDPPSAVPSAPVSAPIPPIVATPQVQSVSVFDSQSNESIFGSRAGSASSMSASMSAAPASVELDVSVYEGEEENAQLISVHQTLSEGLIRRQLSAPTRYRPGQKLNPSLIDAALEIFNEQGVERNEDLIETVMNEAFGVGALQPLIEDQSVEEIYLNGAYQLLYRQAGDEALRVNQTLFSSIEQAKRAAMRILHGLGGEGQTRAEGRFGTFHALVDLEGAEGPNVRLNRSKTLSMSEMVDANTARQVEALIARGGKVAIASSHVGIQAAFTSALSQSIFANTRSVLIGLSQSLGAQPCWLTLPGTDAALDSVYSLNPEAVIIADQASLSGSKVMETLSASSTGILMMTARDSLGAVSKLRRRAGNDELLIEALDAILYIGGSHRAPQLQQIYLISAGQVIFSEGVWSGQLI